MHFQVALLAEKHRKGAKNSRTEREDLRTSVNHQIGFTRRLFVEEDIQEVSADEIQSTLTFRLEGNFRQRR